MGVLDGKTAIVTGGAKSIGREFAGALAAEGAAIVVADIEDPADTVQWAQETHGADAVGTVTDVSDEASVVALVAMAMDRFGRIDILVNNAARFATLPLLPYRDIPVDMWDGVMAVNVRGPFLMAKHVAPYMVAAGRGKIVNVSSGTAYKGMPNMLAYVTSKAALLGFTRCLARELGGHGICVNTLAPGLVESPSLAEHDHHLSFSDTVIASRSIPRAERPEDLLGALVFLCSQASDFMTGQTLAVDGGSINT